MFTFARILKQEQPAINAALEAAITRLPAPVREVAAYAVMAGGKRLRPLLTLNAARLFGCNKSADIYALAAVLEMIHVASLLHDDILDDADTRRGKKAAHLVYGIAPSLLTGDALMASASQIVAAYGNPAMVECISDAIVWTVSGETQEIALKGSLSHGMDQYLEVITGKTGWLIRAAGRLGALYANASPEHVQAVSDFGLNVGIAFQIVDDALDFADESITGKPTGGDLREGKLTPPVMRYVEALPAPDKAAFAVKFASGDFTRQEITAISHNIRAHGYDAQTRALADSYLRQADVNLDALPDTPERKIFRKVLAYVRDREA